MLVFSNFYRAHGIRQLNQLVSPPMTALSTLFLPMNSIYHYTDADIEHVGITPDDDLLHGVKNDILVDHVTDLDTSAQLGEPLPITIQTTTLIAGYHRDYKQFKRIANNASMLKNPRSLLVESYNLIARRYRYTKTLLTPYYKWANLHQTVIANINRLAATTDRHHFIQVQLPPQLPPLSWLEHGITHRDSTFMTRFNTDSLRVILDLYIWVSEARTESLFSHLDPKILDRVSLLFVYGGQWTALNLGTVDKWRADHTKDVPGVRSEQSGKVEPDVLKRRYLKFLMSISETTTVVDTMAAEVEPEPAGNAELEREISSDDLDEAIAGNDSLTTQVQAVLDDPKPIGDLSAIAAVQSAADDDSDEITDITDAVYSDVDIDKDLDALERIGSASEQAPDGYYKPYEPASTDLAAGVVSAADALARQGKLSAAEYRRLVQLSTRYKTIKNPFNPNETLEQMATIAAADLKIPDKNPLADHISGVNDQSMLSSSLKSFDTGYVRNVLHKDVAAGILQLQRAGIIVNNYTVQPVDDFTDSFDIHTVSVIPVVGKPTTLRFQLPRVNENGHFKAAGVKNRMRKQRGDLPIRKVAPNKVALTSYYSKMFVTRSERSAFDYGQWIADKVTAMAIDPANSVITDVKLADVFDPKYDLPRLYTILAQRISSFTSGEYRFFFDYGRRLETFGLDIMTVVERHATKKALLVPVARSASAILLMNRAGDLLKASLTDADTGMELLGSFEQYLSISVSNRPIDVAEVSVFGKLIPLGIVLAHQLGLGNLLATLGTNHRRVAKGEHLQLKDTEAAIRFEDVTLVIERTGVSELIIGGFLRYHREIKRYSIYMFDKKEVYANVLDANGIGVRWVREFDLMFKLWVDHITRSLLEEMHEPTDLVKLFVRSAELLLTDQSPHQMDITYMRDKGYERFAGMVYFELIKAMRGYVSRPATANAAVDLNPQAVWMSILQDQSVMPIEESNPVHALREKEEVIYSGSGGRTARSMTAEARVFHASCKGTVSEATKDSGDVATVTYATADPMYNSLRGTTNRITEDAGNAARIVSTSMLLASGADRDDPKRVNFISVQNSQTTHCEGYTPVPCRTGYERVLAHRTDDLFAKTARTDGSVTAVSDKVVTVTYTDGEVVNYEIGRRFGIWSGTLYRMI